MALVKFAFQCESDEHLGYLGGWEIVLGQVVGSSGENKEGGSKEGIPEEWDFRRVWRL